MGAYRAALSVIRQRLLDDRLLADEYRAVIEHDQMIEHSIQDSQAPTSIPRNRYTNVLPYDYNRVKLSAHSNNYINASNICYKEPGSNGFELKYIAMQGPLQSTVDDFWHLIVEQGVECIVMLTNTFERGILKCTVYFPEAEGSKVTVADGLIVQCVQLKRSRNGDLTVRRLEMHRPGRPGAQQTTSLMHYQYHAWPDHGAPSNSAAIRGLAKMIHSWRMENGGINRPPDNGNETNRSHRISDNAPVKPVVVHCSAGIGRTGAFIVVDIMRQRLRRMCQCSCNSSSSNSSGSVNSAAIARVLDFPTLLCQLRLQRMGMVQTFEQYIFCYQAMYEELTELISAESSGNR